jgi:hypothetical protein
MILITNSGMKIAGHLDMDRQPSRTKCVGAAKRLDVRLLAWDVLCVSNALPS